MSDPVEDTRMQRGDSIIDEAEKQAGMSHFPLLVMLHTLQLILSVSHHYNIATHI